MTFEYPDLMPQMLAKRAGENGADVALKQVDGSVLSWEEAYTDTLCWASALERSGARRGHPVVTLFTNGFDAFRAWQGCAWLGAIESPINTNYKGDWLRHVVNNTEAEVVLADARFARPLFDIADQLPYLKLAVVFGPPDVVPENLPFGVISSDEFIADAQPSERPEPGPWDISSLIYTSGTTGRSKAVMVPWGQLKATMESGFIPLDRLDGIRVYSPFPVFHITGKGGFYSATVFGGASVIREAFSPSEYWHDVRTFDANAAVLLGPLAQMLLNQPEQAGDCENPMETVVMAPVIPEVDAFSERFGVDVFTTYNMTEINSPIVRPDVRCTGVNYSSCGQARAGVQVRIVDEHDIEVAAHTPGELIVRGEPWELNAGYWNMPEKTSEAWRNGWFHTGDAFTYDEDGNYYFVDRAKDYIRRRGENISSFEIETIVNGHPAIAESGAVAVPADEGEDEIKIAVVLESDVSLDPPELIEFLIPRMPRFAIPRYVEFWDELPKTEATARIQKAKIRESGVTAETWDRVSAGVVIPR
ncbi:MAG: AMP-binding protein [Pseudomonadales bacterium]|nr:AMP-binding protein [Pseudomonadales bacterium]MDP6472537.1 AMP-binding protein [Pseudomonadales bacterium]MDP6829018.1 AMP-binding protein [Pseudomonadales bacterium]MDP6969913.1 AMP-binding protein [Pseudomonadales bacterium]